MTSAKISLPSLLSTSPRTVGTIISHVYIQQSVSGQIEPEHEAVRRVLESHGIPTATFTLQREKRAGQRFGLPAQLGPMTLVVGDHDAIRLALNQLNIFLGESSLCLDSYPASLRSYLRRPVQRRTLKQVKQSLNQQSSNYYACPRQSTTGIFVKPLFDTKVFTGTVLHGPSDLHMLGSAVTNKTSLWVSPAVYFLAEYRVFVLHDKVVGVRHYAGDATLNIDMQVVRQAIGTLKESDDPEYTDAYALDFGILAQDEKTCGSETKSTMVTALVEWNDAYALGSYGLDPTVYTKIIVVRWIQLMTQHRAYNRSGF